MDPTAIYASIFLGAVLVGIGALIVAPAVKRRCPECGWFAGHCSHTAVLGSDGRYHSPDS